MATDVDYKVFENENTYTKHLVIDPGFVDRTKGITVCGIKMRNRAFRYTGMNLPAFWRLHKKCKNCARAAKR